LASGNASPDSDVRFPEAADGDPAASLVVALLESAARDSGDPALQPFQQIRLRHHDRRRQTEIADLLTAFEIARACSRQAVEIATFVANEQQRRLTWHDGHRSLPLSELSLEHGTAQPVETVDSYESDSRVCWPEEVTRRASAASGAVQSAGTDDRKPRGERFALLGGTAELSPAPYLLAAGADVLVTHSSGATPHLHAEANECDPSKGRLHFVRGGLDLLSNPSDVAATIVRFAAGQPVHLGLLAYRGGHGQEWRLIASMDAAMRMVQGEGLLASLTVYHSPSVPTEVPASVASESQRRFTAETTPLRSALSTVSRGMLFRANIAAEQGRYWTRSAVPAQGVSYLAGNLLGKRYGVEACRVRATATGTIRISDNIAPIALTCSTAVGAARTALAQLPAEGIRVFTAAAVRRMMYALMMEDLFGPGDRSPGPGEDGGVSSHPYALNSVLLNAYLKGRFRPW
jgi:hypothetical protein